MPFADQGRIGFTILGHDLPRIDFDTAAGRDNPTGYTFEQAAMSWDNLGHDLTIGIDITFDATQYRQVQTGRFVELLSSDQVAITFRSIAIAQFTE